MARVKKAVGDLRARIANCSVKAAFALYAAIAIIAAIALTAIFSVVASLVAESTVEEDSDAYSGTFVFDEASNSLVPAETLLWYEAPRLRVPLRARRDGGPGGRERREDLVPMGGVGRGKAHMAPALRSPACEAGPEARFFTASSLVMRLRRARDEGRLDGESEAVGRARLLVIDEPGFLPLDPDGARPLFQVFADACERQSAVITTNLESGRRGSVLGDDQMAAAVIDRIIHHGRLIRFRGESYRVRNALMREA